MAVFVSVGLHTITPLFSLLGAEGGILEYIDEYMRVWYVGMVFVVVPMVGNNIIRATGDSKTPGIVMIVGASANVILDPILIFGPRAGPRPRYSRCRNGDAYRSWIHLFRGDVRPDRPGKTPDVCLATV